MFVWSPAQFGNPVLNSFGNGLSKQKLRKNGVSRKERKQERKLQSFQSSPSSSVQNDPCSVSGALREWGCDVFQQHGLFGENWQRSPRESDLG